MAILVLEHSDLVGAGRLGEMLRDHGHLLRICRTHRGDALPPDLDDVDGIVSCGGAPSAYDDSLPWLTCELELMRQARDLGLPIIGFCLGSQIAARAFGGEVAAMSGGIELGWHPVHLTGAGTTDPIHAGIGWTTMQCHWHRDHVAKPPPDALVLAKSARCRVQAWSLGPRIYGFQYHPEITRREVEAWLADEPATLHEAGVSREEVMRATDIYLPDAMRIASRLFDAIALLVMPLDRRVAGIQKDLHH